MYISRRTIQHLRETQTVLNRLEPEAPETALPVPGSPMPQGDVIIFTGSFNPPTVAHLALLKQAWRFARQRGNTMLYTAFSKRTVDKEGVERPLLLDRIYLLEKVLKTRLPHTGIVLFNRGLYVEQAQALRISFPRVQRIYFLMGFDKIVQILDPRYYTNRDEALTQLFVRAQLLVAPRGSGGVKELQELIGRPQNSVFARYIHPLPFDPAYREISSTEIRQATAHPSRHTHLVPQEVRQFIRETHPYTAPIQRPDGTVMDLYAEHARELQQMLGMPVS